MHRFENRVAIVTGGVSGIGAAVVARLKREGAKVVVWDLSAAPDADLSEVLDLTDCDAVQRAADHAASKFGRIDVLVACAGITGPNGPTWTYPVADWKRVMDVNVNAVFYCNRAVVPHMQTGGYGRIVNIASVAGKEGNPNASAYSTSKAAVIGLTKSLGKELAQTEIRVNCVTPAAVRTPIFDQMSQQHIDFMLSKIPMGRFGTTDEVASLVCWLASDEAAFSTAAVFDCSGGRATY